MLIWLLNAEKLEHMIITKTPVRISLFGGGTDYPDYFLKNRGAVLGTTINKYIYLSVNKLSQFFDYKIKISYSNPEKVHDIDAIQHPSVKACLKHANITDGLDIHVFADLPAKTGLGSSSSFTVGLLNALYSLNAKKFDKSLLARDAIYVEQQLIKEKVGSQDQVHAAHGGFNLIEFDKDGHTVCPLSLEPSKIELLEDNLLLFYTGINRFAEDILDEQIKNTKTGSKDVYLKKMLSMVYEAKDILQQENGTVLTQKLGAMLHQSWELKKQLSSKISNERIDNFYTKALKAGALGGKLCGAGHGGFLLIMAPKEKHPAIRSALSELMEVQFKFETDGTKIIYQQ